MNHDLAVQLYSVRDLTVKDFAGTLKELAKIGFHGVELAGFGNLKTAEEVRKAVDDAQTHVWGMHAPIDQLEKELSRIAEQAELLGKCKVVCPWLPENRRSSADAWKANAESFNTIGAELGNRGIDFAYHNHSFEFQKFDGKYGLDILWETTDPSHVKAELDVYWVQHGGLDPVQYLDQLAGRTLLVHLKDMAGDPEKRFAPVGTGILDFPGIFKAMDRHNVKWGIVEQDNCYETPSLEAMKIAYQNIRGM